MGAIWAPGETIYRSFGLADPHRLDTSPQVLDINGDGIADFRLNWDQNNTIRTDHGFSAPFRFAGINGGSFSFSASGVAIADGSEVGPASNWWTAGNAADLATMGFFSRDGTRSWTDLLADGGTHTIGVRFETGAGLSYGWIRYRDYVGDGTTEWGPQVVDFAYNSVPDKSIFSGIVPVPEPGTSALFCLGVIALAGRSDLRRRVRFLSPASPRTTAG